MRYDHETKGYGDWQFRNIDYRTPQERKQTKWINRLALVVVCLVLVLLFY